MATWFTADQHVGHANVIAFDGRPWPTLDEMEAGLADRWNARVEPGDTVYVLGDLAYGNPGRVEGWLAGLNGTVKVVPGGHDRRWIKRMKKSGAPYATRQGDPVEILPPLTLVTAQWGRFRARAVLCHYPLLAWDGSHHGVWHLHGHRHTKGRPYNPRAVDVGVVHWGYAPASPAEIEERIAERLGMGMAFYIE